MSKRLNNRILGCFCAIIHGDRGSGKSTLAADVVDVFKKAGYEVYCQYPYKGCKQIPIVESNNRGVVRYDVDKEWLYSANLSHSCVIIDEARTVWPARGYVKWTQSDEDFFNFLRKNDTHVFLLTQAYDGIDLNCKRAADYTFFMTNSFLHFSHIECSHTMICKVADKTTEVVGRMFKKGMNKVSYDICEVPAGNFYFWRKKWYNKFVSTYTFLEKPFIPVPDWEDVIDFRELQEQQGYVERSYIFEKVKEYVDRLSDFVEDKYYGYHSAKTEEAAADALDEAFFENITDEEFFSNYD